MEPKLIIGVADKTVLGGAERKYSPHIYTQMTEEISLKERETEDIVSSSQKEFKLTDESYSEWISSEILQRHKLIPILKRIRVSPQLKSPLMRRTPAKRVRVTKLNVGTVKKIKTSHHVGMCEGGEESVLSGATKGSSTTSDDFGMSSTTMSLFRETTTSSLVVSECDNEKNDNKVMNLDTDGHMCRSTENSSNQQGNSINRTEFEPSQTGIDNMENVHVLPKWIDSVEQCTISCDQQLDFDKEAIYQHTEHLEIDHPVPSTHLEKESRRIARQKQLDTMKKNEQAEQRRQRFFKRQKRVDDDDGVPTSSTKVKKRVMWQEENLVEFHVYSPVSIEEREQTPVVFS